VISVNGWMNHPTGFQLREGKAVDVHPVQALFGNSYFWHELVHMYLAGYMVTGFLVAAAYAAARLRGRWGRYERTALAVPLAVAALCAPVQGARRRLERACGGAYTADQARCLRRARGDQTGGTRALARLVQGWPRRVRDPDPAWAFAARLPRPGRSRRRPRRRGGDERPPVNVVRIAFQTMVGIGTLLALLGVTFLAVRWRRKRLPGVAVVLPRTCARGAALGRGADLRLGDDRGRAPTLGRLPGHANLRRRHRAGGIPVGYATLALVYLALALAVAWILRRLARAPLDPAHVAAKEP
jgi:cytochrome d ubiquinol oxidase subunit I